MHRAHTYTIIETWDASKPTFVLRDFGWPHFCVESMTSQSETLDIGQQHPTLPDSYEWMDLSHKITSKKKKKQKKEIFSFTILFHSEIRFGIGGGG